MLLISSVLLYSVSMGLGGSMTDWEVENCSSYPSPVTYKLGGGLGLVLYLYILCLLIWKIGRYCKVVWVKYLS